MTAYQAGIAKFEADGAQVFGISTDNLPTLRHWSEELKAGFAMLSDFMRETSKSYGTLMADRGISNRATFVIDRDGRIAHIEEGSGAVDPTGAGAACSRLKK
jgi:peroxiredoxin